MKERKIGMNVLEMARKMMAPVDPKIERNIKDSVFCHIFGIPAYLFQLYQALHPEDTKTKLKDLKSITLSRVFTRGMFNDLGFLAGNSLLILVEAQSTWSENILIRSLLYLGETYRRYCQNMNFDLYSSKTIELPYPEIYVIYTGDRKTRPDKITLKQCIFKGYGCLDLEAKMIYDGKKGDIINQYVTFTKIFDRMRKKYKNEPIKAVQETIRICKSQNILKQYLEREEAAVVMFDYADQELALKLTIEEEKRLSLNQGKKIGRRDGMKIGRRDGMKIGEKKGEKKGEKIGRRDGMKIGRRDGMKIGKRDEKQETVKRMLAQKKLSLEDIAIYTALPLAEIQRIAALSGSDPRDQI